MEPKTKEEAQCFDLTGFPILSPKMGALPDGSWGLVCPKCEQIFLLKAAEISEALHDALAALAKEKAKNEKSFCLRCGHPIKRWEKELCEHCMKGY